MSGARGRQKGTAWSKSNGRGDRVSTAADQAYEQLRTAILEGEMRPGERVIEQRLARALEMSRTPIREALARLYRENLLERSMGGLTVRSLTAKEVRDIYDLRAHVESFGARHAAQNISDYELDALRRLNDEMWARTREHRDRPDDRLLKEIASINQRFHQLVVEAARSAPLERAVRGLVEVAPFYKAQLWYDDDNRDDSAQAHTDLVVALEQRDPETAERVWRDHLLYGRNFLLEQLARRAAERPQGSDEPLSL